MQGKKWYTTFTQYKAINRKDDTKMKATEWKCGLSTNVRLINKETFYGYAKAGIDCMEVSCGHLGDDKNTDYKELKSWAKEYSVRLWSYHIPFAPFEDINIASLDEKLRKNSVALVKKSIDTASYLETKIAVIHPSGEPNKPEERTLLIEAAKESLAEIAEYASQKNIVIAVEDLPRTCLGNSSSDILELIKADDRLRVCFDTNHLLEEKNTGFIRACGDKIVTTHVSDYDFMNERHWLPYEGKNDWIGMVNALEDVGFSGPFLFEIGLAAPETIKRRNLTYEDFYNCYKACVYKEPFAAIGSPVAEVCNKQAYFKEPKI